MVATLVTGIAAVCAPVVLVLFMRATPRGTFILWACVLFLVPVWIGQTLGSSFFLSALTLVTLLAVVALGGHLHPAPSDLFVLVLVVITLTQLALGLVTASTAATTLFEWILPYVWGRLLLSHVPTDTVTHWLALLAVTVAGLAVIEFLTRTNVFVLMGAGNSLYTVWGPLQERAGVLRAEGAWGHSIALGAALAMSSPFVLVAPWRTSHRLVGLLVVTAGCVLTFSRVGILTLAVSVVLSLALLPEVGRRLRVLVPMLGLAVAAALVPLLSAFFTQAGNEAAGSASYRGDLLPLFAYVPVFGAAPSFRGTTISGTYLGHFAASTDNAVLLTGLRLGWVGLALFALTVLLAVAPLVLPRRATPASVALAAQVPTLLVVALITQYAMYFWFLVGLTVAWNTQRAGAVEHARTGPVRSSQLSIVSPHDEHFPRLTAPLGGGSR